MLEKRKGRNNSPGGRRLNGLGKYRVCLPDNIKGPLEGRACEFKMISTSMDIRFSLAMCSCVCIGTE